MDKLAHDAKKALEAGMSYGQWKAKQPIKKAMPRKIPDGFKVYVCENCGCEFMAPVNKNRKYCDDLCKAKANRRQSRERQKNKDDPGQETDEESEEVREGFKVCVCCGRQFPKSSRSNNAKTCSERCSRENNLRHSRDKWRQKNDKAPAKIANCVVCGKEFLKIYSRKITCSPECSIVNKEQKARASREMRKMQK